MSDEDWDWNPTFVTPEGEPVFIPRTEPEQDHRDPDILRELYHGEGMSQPEIAEHLGVKRTAVQRTMQKHGIETRRGVNAVRGKTVGAGERFWDKIVEDGGTRDVDRDEGCTGPDHEVFECPECGREYRTRYEESLCMNRHARRLADRLEETEPDVLEIDNSGGVLQPAVRLE